MPLLEAQNHILLLMVLFENVMVGNARSEKHSGLKNILRNPFLIYGTILAQLVHIVAMHFGPFANSLGLSPIPIEIWFKYLLIATSVFIVIELQKLFSKRVVHFQTDACKFKHAACGLLHAASLAPVDWRPSG